MWERDGGQCIFCQMGFHMRCKNNYMYSIYDTMHFVNKSQGGLGVEQNGAIGCRYHHNMLDNGSKGLREQMIDLFRIYLQNLYSDWDENELKYNKWKLLKWC